MNKKQFIDDENKENQSSLANKIPSKSNLLRENSYETFLGSQLCEQKSVTFDDDISDALS